MSKRSLVAKIIPRPLHIFDMINYGARYAIEAEGFFGDVPQFPERMALHEFVSAQCGGDAIDYLEFGVWRGETLKKWLSMNGNPQSRFFGFDSFEGLPEDWEKGQPKGTFSTNGSVPDVSDSRASFVVGWFNETLYGFIEHYALERRLVVHIDCDLYSSTLFVLAALDRHLPSGAIVVFDDFHSLTHEFAAWLDYRRSFGRKWAPLASTGPAGQAAVRLVE